MSDLQFNFGDLSHAATLAEAYGKVKESVPGAHGIYISNAYNHTTESPWKAVIATDSAETTMVLSAHLHAELPGDFFSSVAASLESEEDEPYTENHASNFPDELSGLVAENESTDTPEEEADEDEDSEELDEDDSDDEEEGGDSEERPIIRKRRPPIAAVRGKHSGITIEKSE